MEPHNSLAKACKTQATWWRNCWHLRSDAQKALDDLREVREKFNRERDAHHIAQLELSHARAKLEMLEDQHAKAKEGNRALMRFIHTRHKLNIPFTADTILQELEKMPQ